MGGCVCVCVGSIVASRISNVGFSFSKSGKSSISSNSLKPDRHYSPSLLSILLRYVSFPMHISHAGCIQTPLILITCITVRLRVIRQLSELTFVYCFQDASSPPSVDAPLLRSDRSWQAARPCGRPVARRDSVGTKCRLQSHCAFSNDQRTPNNGEILVQTIYCC